MVEDTQQYIEDGLDHLSDESIYREIHTDPTKSLAVAINTYVDSMYQEGIIDPLTKKHLTLETDPPPRTQQLYFLKKIHKNPIAVRPIVSGCGGPTENISQLVDLQLKPHIPEIKSYIKDSGHLISLLENTPIPKNCTLITIDVKSLYLNIPHKDGINAVLNRLYHTQEQADQMTIPPGTMADLLGIVLEQNYFQFADKMYHQVQGTAMGTKMAPSYANIFMAELEERLLDNYPIKPLLWKRYIDDILCIWPEQPSKIDHFIKYLNQSHPTIKFTYEYSTQSINFLDLTIYKGTRHMTSLILDFKPFFKTTNKFQYLEYNSAHPKSIFSSLVKGELTRLLRACSDQEAYERVTNKLLAAFKDRGYPNYLLQTTLQQVPFLDRARILNKRMVDRQPINDRQIYDTFFKVNYTPDLDTRSLRQIIKPTTQEEGNVPKPCLCLSKTDNLAKILVRAKLKNYPDPPKLTTPITIQITKPGRGNSMPCEVPGCQCCATMSKKCRVTSTHNNRTFPTQMYTSCSTRNAVYLIECTKCTKGNQFVSHTSEPLRAELSKHRTDSTIKLNLPLYKHFFQKAAHNFERDIRITILQSTARDHLPEAQRDWSQKMDTTFPKGLNN